MSPAQPDGTEVIIGWVMKIGGVVITFIGGIVTATATITLKMKGYDDRIKSLEVSHTKCEKEILKGIADKLDNIPSKLDVLQDNLDEKMEKKFCRVHDRIDTLILKEKSHDDASIKRDDMTLKKVNDVRDNQ